MNGFACPKREFRVDNRVRSVAAAALATMVWVGSNATAQDCGASEMPCEIEAGTYHILLPDTQDLVGTVIHLHGGGGTGTGLLDGAMAREALERGYAFIAPNGFHPNSRFTRDWSVRANNSSHDRDDIAFLRDVLGDAGLRFGINQDNVLLSGFSRGGSMVWDVACHAPDLARAFAPASGAFWDDMPESCVAPVDLFHTHGWNDRTVPLEGRSLFDDTIVQGDVWASLFILRETNGCRNRQPATTSGEAGFWWRHWTDCDAGRIDLLLFQGGHGVPQGWPDLVLDWYEALDPDVS